MFYRVWKRQNEETPSSRCKSRKARRGRDGSSASGEFWHGRFIGGLCGSSRTSIIYPYQAGQSHLGSLLTWLCCRSLSLPRSSRPGLESPPHMIRVGLQVEGRVRRGRDDAPQQRHCGGKAEGITEYQILLLCEIALSLSQSSHLVWHVWKKRKLFSKFRKGTHMCRKNILGEPC